MLQTLLEAIVADESVVLVAFCLLDPVDTFVDEAAQDLEASEIGNGRVAVHLDIGLVTKQPAQ